MNGWQKTIHSMAALNRAAEQEAVRRCQAPHCPEQAMGLKMAPGTEVLDLVTGEKGVILAGTRAESLVPTTRR